MSKETKKIIDKTFKDYIEYINSRNDLVMQKIGSITIDKSIYYSHIVGHIKGLKKDLIYNLRKENKNE